MDRVRSFTDLRVWQEGHLLVLLMYKVTRTFPKEELFGLVSQMRRCVVSITSNISEGFSRTSSKEKIQFYATSLGSVTELQNQLLIAKDLGFLKEEDFRNAHEHSIAIHKMLKGLIKSSMSRSRYT